MSASLTRTVGFHALHRLYRRDWSEAQNREVFGPLADPPGHGHDYECAVTVAGPRGVVLERVRIKEDPTLYGDCTGIA